MSTRKRKSNEVVSTVIPFRVGSYTPRKIGNNWKISIPSDIATVWKLENRNKSAQESKNKKEIYDEKELIIYVEEREGKLCLVITKEPLEDDPIAKFLRKTEEENL